MFAYTKRPHGAHPIQAEGMLCTGQAFYFRSRGSRTSLTISVDGAQAVGVDGTRVAKAYQERILELALHDGDTDVIVTRLIERWVGFYLKELAEAHAAEVIYRGYPDSTE